MDFESYFMWQFKICPPILWYSSIKRCKLILFPENGLDLERLTTNYNRIKQKWWCVTFTRIWKTPCFLLLYSPFIYLSKSDLKWIIILTPLCVSNCDDHVISFIMIMKSSCLWRRPKRPWSPSFSYRKAHVSDSFPQMFSCMWIHCPIHSNVKYLINK